MTQYAFRRSHWKWFLKLECIENESSRNKTWLGVILPDLGAVLWLLEQDKKRDKTVFVPVLFYRLAINASSCFCAILEMSNEKTTLRISWTSHQRSI